MEEIQALLYSRRSVIVDASAVEGQGLYRFRSIYYSEPDETKKYRLYVTACHKNDHGLVTAALTIKKLSFQLLLLMYTADRLNLHIRDVTKVFVVCKNNLQHPFSRKLQRKCSYIKSRC